MAITISAGDLPADIQSCGFAGTCSVNTNSITDISNSSGGLAMSAFTMSRNGTLEYLLQYNLVVPSGDDGNTTAYNGSVWLAVAQQYNLSTNNHLMSLYLDKVLPQPVNLLGGVSDGLNLDILVDSQGLLNGSLFQSIGCCDPPFGIDLGNMFIQGDFGGGALLPCAADGCEVTATLDLLFLDYIDVGGVALASINPGDSRSRLFSVSSSFEGTRTQSYYVSAVPVPAAVWLFTTGLIGLIGLARRKAHV